MYDEEQWNQKTQFDKPLPNSLIIEFVKPLKTYMDEAKKYEKIYNQSKNLEAK